MLTQKRFFFTLLVCILFANASFAATHYVNSADIDCDNATTDSNTTPFCTITSALGAASNGDTIEIGGAFYSETLPITDLSITLKGTSDSRPILHGGDTLQFISASNFVLSDVVLEHLEFRNGISTGSGGAVYLNNANLTITDCAFKHNEASSGYGGAISLTTGTLTITDSSFDTNESIGGPGVGGAVHATVDELLIDNSTFNNNTTTNGAAVFASIVTSAGYSITNSTFTDNTATAEGGALYLSMTSASTNGTVSNTTFTNNDAGTNAGAIYAMNGIVEILGSTFDGNWANLSVGSVGGAIVANGDVSLTVEDTLLQNNRTETGGALYFLGATATNELNLVSSEFVSNYASSMAGAVFVTGGSIQIQDSTFSTNEAVALAGALYLSGQSIVFDTVTVANNQASSFGSAYLNATTTLSIDHSVFSDNQAGTFGSPYFTSASTTDYDLTIRNSAIIRNSASNFAGPMVVANNSRSALINTTVSGNTATDSYAGAYVSNDADFFNVTVANNAADSDGSGIGSFGGLMAGTTVTLYNSILANNTDAAIDPDCQGTVVLNHSLIEEVSAGCIVSSATGEITGTDPLLAVLNDNGGNTYTHALLTDSPAIDAGDASGCVDETGTEISTDQRGYAINGTCDMGAYESGCGDGIIQGDEECDDGNSNDADGCDASCETVAAIADDVATCGDGTVDSDEECDDGNTDSDDGCSSTCVVDEDTSASADDTTGGGGGCQLQTQPDSTTPFLSLSVLATLVSMLSIRRRACF